MDDAKFKRTLRRIKREGEQYKRIQELKDSYAEYMPNKNKRKVSNVMLVIIIFAIVAYTIASFWIQYKTSTSIDPTLSSLYYGFWTVELIALTTIKNNKTKYGQSEYKDNTNDDCN